jgi:hypothetical protein
LLVHYFEIIFQHLLDGWVFDLGICVVGHSLRIT